MTVWHGYVAKASRSVFNPVPPVSSTDTMVVIAAHYHDVMFQQVLLLGAFP